VFGSIFRRGREGREGEQIFLKFDCIVIIILKLISNLNINLVTTFIIIRLYYLCVCPRKRLYYLCNNLIIIRLSYSCNIFFFDKL